jgi:hypothetical protein
MGCRSVRARSFFSNSWLISPIRWQARMACPETGQTQREVLKRIAFRKLASPAATIVVAIARSETNRLETNRSAKNLSNEGKELNRGAAQSDAVKNFTASSVTQAAKETLAKGVALLISTNGDFCVQPVW